MLSACFRSVVVDVLEGGAVHRPEKFAGSLRADAGLRFHFHPAEGEGLGLFGRHGSLLPASADLRPTSLPGSAAPGRSGVGGCSSAPGSTGRLRRNVHNDFLRLRRFSRRNGGRGTPAGVRRGNGCRAARPRSGRLRLSGLSRFGQAMTRSPSPLAWRPDFPGAPREAH